MSSAAEAELGGLFINAKEAVPLRNTLEELGHPQPPTPIRTDNKTAHGIIYGSCKPQKTKSMDMNFYWLKDRGTQAEFDFYWEPGTANTGDFHTKHHPRKYHRAMRPFHVHTPEGLQTEKDLRGCADPRIPGLPGNTGNPRLFTASSQILSQLQ